METQPHLLLLQKVMVVAEGVGRTLNPEVNMWQVAQPLIEEWIIANKNPETHLRELGGLVSEIVQRGPRFLANAELALENTNQMIQSKKKHDLNSRLREGWMWAAIGMVALLALYALAD